MPETRAERRAFTALGEPELEARVRADVAQLARRVQTELGAHLGALLLGGGYGRGEGGGRRDDHGRWAPLNDYDLVAVVTGVPAWRLPALRSRLTAVAEACARELGVEVELAPLRHETLRALPFTMMWCELFAQPRIVAGDAHALASARPLPPASLPAVEAVRYLANRAALLLWARLEDLPPERTWKFVAKAWLACGAAALIAGGRFAVGYGARQASLAALGADELPAVDGLAVFHERACAERLRPSAPPADLAAAVTAACNAVLTTWRWCENRRMGQAAVGASWDDYARASGLFREPLSSAPGNLLRQLRWLGWHGLVPIRALREHPRGRVLRSLPAALAGVRSPAAAALLHCPVDGLGPTCLRRWRENQA